MIDSKNIFNELGTKLFSLKTKFIQFIDEFNTELVILWA
jgi:hypothetical protein